MKIARYTLVAISSVSIMCTSVMSPALPHFIKFFGSFEAMYVKVGVTIPSLFIAISSPIFGLTLRKVENKLRLTVLGLILYAIFGILSLFCDQLPVFIASRCVLGVAIGLLMTISMDIISHIFQGNERNKIIASQTVIMSIGTMLFTFISGIIVDVHWRFVFALYLIPLALIPIILTSIEKKVFIVQYDDAQKSKYSITESLVYRILYVFRNSSLHLFIYIVSIVNIIFFYMIPVQIPLALGKIIPNISGKMIANVIIIEVIAAAIFANRYKRLKTRNSFQSICAMAFGLMSTAYLILSYAKGYWIVCLAMVIYGIGMGIMMPNNSVWVIEHSTPKNRSILIGGLITSIYLGKFLSPIAVQPFIAHFGIFKSYRVAAICMLFVGILVTSVSHLMKASRGKRVNKT